MSLTIIGLIVITTTIIFILKRKNLVPLAIAVAPLQGASVINIQHYIIGISPYYFVLVIVNLRFFLKFIENFRKGGIRRKKYNNHIVNSYFLFLNIFLAWATLSLFFPFVFEGMKVYVPRMGIKDELGDLAFSMSNIAQFIYLVLNIVFINEIYQYSLKNGTNKFIKLTLFCGTFVALLGLWDFSGLGFPREFFLNNITSTLDSVKDYRIIGRVASTFSEPSVAAAFLTPFLMMTLASLLTFKVNFTSNLLITILSLFLLFTTFSTTAYLTIVLALIPLIFCVFLRYLNQKLYPSLDLVPMPKRKNNNRTIKIVILLLVISCLFLLVIVNIDKYGILMNVLDDVVFKKSENLSAIHRSTSNTYGYKLLFDTFGLGVGIGGNRPSSFAAYLASNFGMVGIIFYVGNIILILVYSFKKLFLENRLLYQQFFLLWSANFIAMSLSVPDLNWPYLWIYTGFILSTMNQEKINSISEEKMLSV